jgi:4-oxalocrotonate tautomerase
MPVVNIQMFEGRDEAKASIAKDVTESIAKHTGVDPQYVYVIFLCTRQKNKKVC